MSSRSQLSAISTQSAGEKPAKAPRFSFSYPKGRLARCSQGAGLPAAELVGMEVS